MSPERTRNDVLRDLAQTDQAVFAQLMRDLEPHPLQRGALLGTPRLQRTFSTSSIQVWFRWSQILEERTARSRSQSSVGKGSPESQTRLGDHPLPYSLVVQLPGHASVPQKN